MAGMAAMSAMAPLPPPPPPRLSASRPRASPPLHPAVPPPRIDTVPEAPEDDPPLLRASLAPDVSKAGEPMAEVMSTGSPSPRRKYQNGGAAGSSCEATSVTPTNTSASRSSAATGELKARVIVGDFRPSFTGLSVSSACSLQSMKEAASSMRIKRSDTVMSALSQKTSDVTFCDIPAGVDCGNLGGRFNVPFNSQSPVTDEYVFMERLGEGGFGQVWKAIEQATGSVVAIKLIPAITMKDVQRYEREVKVFERLSSPYVVKLHSIFKDRERLYLVMDLCTGGDLMAYLLDYWRDSRYPERQKVAREHPHDILVLSPREVGPLIWQMLAGVLYMHHHRFAHRDIKLENYMLKSDGDCPPQLKLCDFGLSVRLEKGQQIRGAVGTMLYMAPEVLVGPYDTKCDIWSVGVTAYLCVTTYSPWGGTMDYQELRSRVLQNGRDPWPCTSPEVSSELRELVDWMLTFEVDSRPSAKDIFTCSKWLKKYGKPAAARGDSAERQKCAIS